MTAAAGESGRTATRTLDVRVDGEMDLPRLLDALSDGPDERPS
ncbi:hypothetical protein [Catellatospora citrea]|nr:hypothetical protein [Catellatospora citrea]